jgi:SAM-dependent methyltransferase
MDPETFAWLCSPAGAGLMARASEAYADADGDPMAAASALARAAGDEAGERRAAALTQVSLRVRAVAKLGEDALRMWFTPDGLEQATRARVAAHRAARLAAAAPASVVDLGCGIGGDLVPCARAGLLVAGVDTDPLRVAVARANLAALELPGAVQEADATTLDLGGFGAVVHDPARRGGTGRRFRPEDWTPPWSFADALLRRDSPPAVVTVAPGVPHDLVPDGVEAEWVSEGGEVKEAALWSPTLATCLRRATVIGTGGLATLTDEDDPHHGAPETDRPVRGLGGYLYEPDGAVIRAGLVTAVAAGVDGGLLDPRIAYVTSDGAYRTPFARGYRVLERFPYREKALRQALRERGVGTLTIKKRGLDVDPDALRLRLHLRGDAQATVVLTRIGGAATAVLVSPMGR